MSTVHQEVAAVHVVHPVPYRIAAPPRPWRPWPPEPGSVPALVHALRLRGVRIYPDLAGGVGFISRGVDYADLRPLLAARKAELVDYLESELWSQRLLELMAFYGWPLEEMRAAWLDRLERAGTRHRWDDARIARWLARAVQVAGTEPEVFVTIGYSTRVPVWYPRMSEVADQLAEYGATEPEILRALRTNTAHHDLRYEDDALLAIARATESSSPMATGKQTPIGVLAFAGAQGFRCVYCKRLGDDHGDPDGRAWQKDHVATHNDPNPFVLACSRCKALPGRRALLGGDDDGI